MRKTSNKFFTILITVLALLSFNSLIAQEISLGTNFVNRYIWRGIDLGSNTPNIQPTVALNTGGFTFGFRRAYSLSDTVGLNKIDIYTSYSFELAESGSLSLLLTDYTNPNSGIKIGNFNNDVNSLGPGAHFIELNIGYSVPESFPISLSFNPLIYNVANNPIYFQIGYNTSVNDVSLGFFDCLYTI